MNVYFDSAATTSLSAEVLEAMLPFMRDTFGNPSSVYAQGRAAKAAIEQSRRTIAGLLNAYPSEIYFTSGGTEADNTFLRGIIKQHRLKQVVSSKLEHHAVLHTLEDLAAESVITLTLLDNDADGRLDLGQLEAFLKKNPGTLVSLMHANNEIGNLNDLEKIAALCEEYAAYFHSDTVQSVGYYPQNLKQLPLHSLAASAHKFHGPKGHGFMFLRKGLKIAPLVTGGKQERGLRGGTESTHGIVGMAKALELSLANREKNLETMQALKTEMVTRLRSTFNGRIIFNGLSMSATESLPGVLNAGFDTKESGASVLFKLDLAGISVSGGSACSSGAAVSSHVIAALGEKNRTHIPIRFSFSKYNNTQEVDFVVKTLSEILG